MVIYKVTFPNNKIYIGQTRGLLKDRIFGHYYGIKKFPKHPLYRTLKKYQGSETWEILDTATSLEELNKKETYWIKKLSSCIYEENSIGYNCNYGGDSREVLEQTKIKISNSLKGKQITPEQRKKQSEALIGVKKTPEHIEKVKNKLKLYRLTDKYKENIKRIAEDRKLNFRHSTESKRKNAISKGGKSFYVLKNNEILGIFYTLSEASIKFHLSNSKICNCLHGKRKSHKGYTFKYIEVTNGY